MKRTPATGFYFTNRGPETRWVCASVQMRKSV